MISGDIHCHEISCKYRINMDCHAQPLPFFGLNCAGPFYHFDPLFVLKIHAQSSACRGDGSSCSEVGGGPIAMRRTKCFRGVGGSLRCLQVDRL